MSVKIAGNTTNTDAEVDTTAKALRVTEYRTDGTVYQAIPTGVYAFNLQDVAGTAGANNFLALFNPAGSGRTLRVERISYNCYGVTTTIAKSSMHVTAITASSGGSLAAGSAIFKFKSSYSAAVAELRSGNPTVTAAAEFLSMSPPVVITAAGTYSPGYYEWTSENDPDREVVLAEGEGLVFRTTVAGDVDQTFNIGFCWMEF